MYSEQIRNTLQLEEKIIYQVFLFCSFLDSPRILSVGPTSVVTAQLYNKTVLTCEAEGNPPPEYLWLQMKTTEEVLIRAHTQEFVIDNVTYDYQGKYLNSFCPIS